VGRQILSRLFFIILITALALWIDFAPGNQFLGRDVSTRLGLDLQGGTQVLLAPRDPNVASDEVAGAAQTIEQRVNGMGLAETLVQVAGGNRVIVELPGVKEPEKAIQTLQGQGSLEFIDPQGQFLNEGQIVCTELNPRLPQAETNPLSPTETLATPTPTLTSTSELTPTDPLSPTSELTPTAALPANDPNAPDPNCGTIYPTIANGADLDRPVIALVYDQQTGQPQVKFKFLEPSASEMQTFTGSNVGQPMSIVLDNRVISSPRIQAMLPGEGVITMGSGSIAQQTEDATSLLTQIKYGALPVPMTVQSSRIISATLGQSALESSIVAGIIGLLAVMLFMLIYYHLPGLVADLALLIYTAILFAIYRYLPVTLTLPGIAGFILSIGLAVDANVLVFARLKEELRLGRPIQTAIEMAFREAWPSIRDSNASTFITSLILYSFGSSFGVSLIKGFALTLMIGVAVGLFTAVFVTRTLMRLMVRAGVATDPWWYGIDHIKSDDEVAA
jgi:preprotein translocase subunit SecD